MDFLSQLLDLSNSYVESLLRNSVSSLTERAVKLGSHYVLTMR